LWLAFYLTLPLFIYDYVLLAWYMELGIGFVILYWYLSFFYFFLGYSSRWWRFGSSGGMRGGADMKSRALNRFR
jgi:hypothetical protein